MLDRICIKIYSIDSKREEKGKKEKNKEIFKKVLTKDKEKHIIKTRSKKEERKMTLRVLTTAEIRQAIESHNLWLIGC